MKNAKSSVRLLEEGISLGQAAAEAQQAAGTDAPGLHLILSQTHQACISSFRSPTHLWDLLTRPLDAAESQPDGDAKRARGGFR